MSNATKESTRDIPSADVIKAQHQIELTNGAIYLLEGCLQMIKACTTPAKVVSWGKCWNFIRSQNDRLISINGGEPFDFEKMVNPPDETPAQQQARIAAINDAHAEWAKQPKVLALSDKRRDVCREAVKYWIAHKDEKQMNMSQNLLMLVEAFGVEGSDDE